ncbi:MAG: RICIN domain-containing protein, partial [Verrucomicrobiota bacterium]|nr:RICIN domain-containing protein [Verrucomicrobiota bacterium]
MKKILGLGFVLSLLAQQVFGTSAQWVHYDSNGNLVYFQDDLGNRIADFSYAGYRGGGVALPNLSVKQTVTPSGGDDTANIQNAINAVAALTPDTNGFRGAVLLKAGNYNISGRINLNANGIVLRGEGNTTSGTVLKVSKASSEVIFVAGSSGRTLTGSSVSITDTYVPLAATTVTVSSASGFAVGDQIAINRPWTQSWIDAIGMNGIWSPNSGIYFERTITAINGNQISFDIPLGNPIEQKFVTGNVQHYTDTGRVQECGVENLYLLCTDTNAVGGARAVLLNNCKNCWTHDVTCDTFNNGFSMSPNSKYCTIQDCVYANGQGGGSARPGCYNIEGEMCLYQRCSTTGIHPVGDGSWILTTQANTAGPDVFFRLNSYSDHTAAQLHARWAASQLIDNLGGSSISSVSIQNLGTGGNGHGWTAGYSIAYNCRCSFSVEQPTVDHHYNWIIGGIGTVNPPGSHPDTGPGTYDTTNAIVTPGSLYLAQLKERLGPAAVENIGYQLFAISAVPNSATVIAGNNATFTVTVSDTNDLQTRVTLGASGLPAGATASFSPSPVVGNGTSTMTITTSSSTPAGTYTLTITGTDGTLTHTTTISLTVNPPSSLPPGWTDADIGSVGLAGSASYSGGTYTVSGSGADIWTTADAFNYAWQSVSGDQTIIARVASENGTASYAKAGVMIRETTAADSVEASVLITPTNGVAMEIRPTTGASSINVAGWIRGISPPQWVKLARSGGTFTGYYSADGSTWTQIASTNVTMAASALAGLAVTSHDNTSLNTATFDNVSIAGPAPDFSITASPPSQTITAGNGASYTTTIGSINGYNGTVSLSVSGLPANASASFNPASVTGSGNSTLTINTTTSTPAGTYTLTITGTDGTLTHSTTVSLTVNAAPQPDFSLSASPTSLTIVQGNNGTSTITINPVNGYNNTVSLSASGLPSGVTASFNPSSTTTSSTLTLTASSTAATGTATVTITGTDGTLTHTTTISLTVNAANGGLPAGWTDADIGSVGLAGSASYSGGTFTVNGSGADIWSTSDAFNYAYQSVSGDQTIIARVASQQNTSSWAKSGAMFRDSTAANGAYVAVYVTPANGVSMQIRPSDGASAIDVARQTGLTAPYWVKIVRSGNTFTGYSSSDGSTWTEVAATNVTMASSVDAGLAVCAHNNTVLNTSTFDNVSISGSSPTPDFSLSASPTSLTIVQGNNGTSTISIVPVNGYNNTVSLSASGLPSGVTASFNPSSTTTSSTLTLSASSTAATGSTTVTISGTDGTLTHTTTISLTVNATVNFSGIYQIQNEASGLVLNQQGKLTNGSPITQWTSVASSNLDWQFFPTSNGYYQINSCKSALDAVVQSASTAAGAGIVQWSFGSSGDDQWQPQQNGDGSYTFVNLHSGLVLGDPGSSTSTST